MTRRISLTIKEKIEVIRNLENDKKQSEIVAEKGISKSVVSRIWKDKESVLKSYSDLPVSIKKRKKSKFNDVDHNLLQWFKEIRLKCLPISTIMLMEQANKIGNNFGFPNFKCSRSWLNRFKKRNSIVIGNINGESGKHDQRSSTTGSRRH